MFIAGFRERLSQIPSLLAMGVMHLTITFTIGYFWFLRTSDPRYFSYIALAQIYTMARSRIHKLIEKRFRLRTLDPLLTKPTPLILYYFLYDLGRTSVTFTALVIFTLPIFIVFGFPSPIFFLLFPFSFSISFLLSFSLGMLAAWLGDVTPVAWIIAKLKIIAGGAVVPINRLSGRIKAAMDILPFRSMAYFPAYASIFALERGDVILAVFHFTLLLITALILEKLAVRKYAMGG